MAPDKATEEPWSSVPDGGIIWVRRARESELSELYDLTLREVGPDIAPFEVLQRLHRHNRDSIWCVCHASDTTRSDAKMVGYFALIHLNAPGLEQLEAGTFDGVDPDIRLIVPHATHPAAIYLWVVVMRRMTRIATWLLANALGAETYGGVSIYAKAGTVGGLNALKGRGFTAIQSRDGDVGQLFRLDRPPVSASSSVSSAA